MAITLVDLQLGQIGDSYVENLNTAGSNLLVSGITTSGSTDPGSSSLIAAPYSMSDYSLLTDLTALLKVKSSMPAIGAYLQSQMSYGINAIADPFTGISYYSGPVQSEVGVFAASFSGVDSFYQQAAGGESSFNGTTVQPGSVTAPVNGCLFISICSYLKIGAAAYPTIDPGFTEQHLTANNGTWGLSIGYKIQSTAAAENPTWTYDIGATYRPYVKFSTTMAVFRPAGGSGIKLQTLLGVG